METCEICNKTMSKPKLNYHLKSKTHLKNELKMKKLTENVEHEDVETHEDNEEIDEDENENEEETKYNEVYTQTDEYLSDFNNISFKVQEQEKPKEIKQEKSLILKNIIQHKQKRQRDLDEISIKSDDFFSDRSKTPILGKTKRELIAKIKQYKLLFPEQLKSFRVKKKATEEELQTYLNEIDCILSTSKLDSFLCEAVNYAVGVIEKMSSLTTNFDLTGIQEMLKNNKEFQDLVRILSIKYNTFSQVSPELQLAIIVTSTSYICVMTNRQKKKILEEQLKNQII